MCPVLENGIVFYKICVHIISTKWHTIPDTLKIIWKISGVVQQMRLTSLHNFYIFTFVSQSRKESLLSAAVNVRAGNFLDRSENGGIVEPFRAP